MGMLIESFKGTYLTPMVITPEEYPDPNGKCYQWEWDEFEKRENGGTDEMFLLKHHVAYCFLYKKDRRVILLGHEMNVTTEQFNEFQKLCESGAIK